MICGNQLSARIAPQTPRHTGRPNHREAKLDVMQKKSPHLFH
jgi:hypothetical protein